MAIPRGRTRHRAHPALPPAGESRLAERPPGLPAGEEGPPRHAVMEALGDGVVVVDPGWRPIQANLAAGAMLGLDRDVAAWDPEWWRAMREMGAGAMTPRKRASSVFGQGASIRDVRVELIRPGSGAMSLSVDFLPVADDAGSVRWLLLSMRDVTDRERERGERAHLQDRLREAHEVARLASWEWDPASGEVSVIHALAEVASLNGVSMALEAFMEYLPADQRANIHADLDSIRCGERDQTIRRHHYFLPSGEAWLETRSRAHRDEQGRLLRVRGTSQDVTADELAKRSVARSRDLLQGTLDSLPAHIAVLDETGEVVVTNGAWSRFGEENGQPDGAGAGSYLLVCDAAGQDPFATRAGAGLRAMLRGEQHEFEMEYPCHGPLGERWFLMRATRFEGGGDERIVIAHTDVSARRRAEAESAIQERLLDEVEVAVVATGLDGRVSHWNRGAEQLYGISCDRARGRPFAELLLRCAGRHASEIAALPPEDSGDGVYRITREDGSVFPAFVRSRMVPGYNGASPKMVSVAADISERVDTQRALRAVRNYMQAVGDSMGEGLYTSDNEGRVTYMNGAASKLLGWTLPEVQGSVAHEFLHSERLDGSPLPIEECPILSARRDGDVVRIDDDVFIARDGTRIPVAYTATPLTIEDRVEGCVVLFQDISEHKARDAGLRRDAESLAWIERVQDAIAEDRLLLYSQPIFDIGTGEEVQHELLLRVREPGGAIVGPVPYLDVAERYGLVGDIDRWVIQRAMELAVEGRPVELNLSARSIGDQAILDHIGVCLRQSGADPALLVFEITETALAEDEQAARKFANSLHALGCGLALDDFGTGYSGFTYLKQLPVDYLKIDIEFVRDLLSSAASRHVVEAVVGLSHSFGLSTVAEGVEDRATLDLLRELGVDFAQGFYLGVPRRLRESVAPAPL